MSERADRASEWRQRLLLAAARWSVPAVYALISACLGCDLWEQRARLALADEVAAIVRTDVPSRLSELIDKLGGRAGTVHRWRREGAEGAVQGANIELVPAVWLHLSTELAADRETLQQIRLIYADSEELPLENPREAIPNAARANGALIALAVASAAIWRASARAISPRTRLEAAGAVASAALLLGYVPIGLISLMRILI